MSERSIASFEQEKMEGMEVGRSRWMVEIRGHSFKFAEIRV